MSPKIVRFAQNIRRSLSDPDDRRLWPVCNWLFTLLELPVFILDQVKKANRDLCWYTLVNNMYVSQYLVEMRFFDFAVGISAMRTEVNFELEEGCALMNKRSIVWDGWMCVDFIY